MSFTKQSQQKQLETIEKDKETGMMSFFGEMALSALPKMLEKATGQRITSNSEILFILTEINNKLDDFMKNCREQFIEQSQQLNSIQKVTKLVSTEKTKAIHFTDEE